MDSFLTQLVIICYCYYLMFTWSHIWFVKAPFFWLLYHFHLIPSFLRTFFMAQGVLGFSWTFTCLSYNQGISEKSHSFLWGMVFRNQNLCYKYGFFLPGVGVTVCLPGDRDRWSWILTHNLIPSTATGSSLPSPVPHLYLPLPWISTLIDNKNSFRIAAPFITTTTYLPEEFKSGGYFCYLCHAS